MSLARLSESRRVAGAFDKAPPNDISMQLADQLRDLWDCGQQVDALTFLEDHPEHAANSCVLLDLAHEEFILRVEANQSVDPDAFAARFPRCQSAIRFLIGTRFLLEGDRHKLAQTCELFPWPLPGQSFLGFDLQRELGRGTFARVYLAREPELGDRPVALKVAQILGSEARTLGRLNHVNIVPVFSVRRDAETGLAAVCMPYLGSATLWHVIEECFAGTDVPRQASCILNIAGTLAAPPAKEYDLGEPDPVLRSANYVEGVLHLGIQLAQGLKYMHDRGIYHRDLKPSNVLLTASGKPVLLDFNLALDSGSASSVQGGTIPYMAPEQLRAVVKKDAHANQSLDGRADIFALGVILYELLSGTHPFGPIDFNLENEAAAEKMLFRLQRGPGVLRAFNQDVDRDLEELINRCLALDPAERPRTAADLSRALQTYCGVGRRATRWIRGHKLTAALVATAVLSTGTVGSAALVMQKPYADRQLHAAAASLDAGNDESAFAAANRAVQARPSSPLALFSRGLLSARLGRVDDARNDFRDAVPSITDGSSLAYIGWFYHKQHQFQDATDCYERAFHNGFRTPELLNNAAYCYYKLAKFNDARQLVEEAIAKAPNLQAPYYLRAKLTLSKIVKSKSESLEEFDSCIKDFQAALDHGPKTADIYVDFARCHAKFASFNPAHIEPALELLRKAVELGYDLKLNSQDKFFLALFDEDEYKLLLAQAPRVAPKMTDTLVLDPFPRGMPDSLVALLDH
jgi:serine/threonine protein kinase/Tfp pilus assembly protein PilF